MKRPAIPCALTIAGSDSGGGAGIQADLKTFAALAVHGTSAITCLTAQNPREVRRVQAAAADMARAQIETVLAAFRPGAVKTGMLFSVQIIDAVLEGLSGCPAPVIVDPVMVATSGARLLRPDAVTLIRKRLLPRAALATPNLPEAELLLEAPITSHEKLRQAAREFYLRFGCPALLKGGHLPGRQAIDFYYDGQTELLLEAPRVPGVSTHGTGCTYSAAITAHRARGLTLPEAVAAAKTFITQAIAASQRCGRHDVLNSLWNRGWSR